MLRAPHGGCGSDLLLHRAFAPPLPLPLPLGLQQAPRPKAAARVTDTHIMAIKNPKGFGPPAPAPKGSKPSPAELNRTDKGASDSSARDEEDDEVPEIVMDRMIKRIGVSIAIPIALAVIVFPCFWYIKVQLRWDVPEWLPLLVSGLLFCSAAFGISYGILSTSWDPLRDGSFLGWKEAQANWPVFFSGLQGSKSKR